MIEKCRICGNKIKNKIAGLCSNMKIMGSNFSEGRCDIVVCSKCGFVYNYYENESQDNFDEYYLSKNSKTVNYYDIFPKELAEQYFHHIYMSIKDFIYKDSSILDIAGGYGEFSRYLMDRGYTNVTMLEMKSECIEYAKSSGVDVIEGNLLEIPIKGDKYNLVICSHNLEHFIDIDKAILKMKEMIHDSGYIYIEVPNIVEYAQLERAPYHFLTYEHVCHFSKQTLLNIASEFGFEIIYIKQYIKCDDYPCLFTLMKKSSGKKGMLKDYISEKSMTDYLKKCECEIATITKIFETNQKPLILWGIGASTAQLLNRCFDACNVVQLIDSNVSRQGINFRVGQKNLTIEDPKNVTNKDATILILPTAYKNSIEKSIREYGLSNHVESLM